MTKQKIIYNPKEATSDIQKGGSCTIHSITNAMELNLYRTINLSISIFADVIYQWGIQAMDFRYNFDSAEEMIRKFEEEFGGLPAYIRDTDEFTFVRLDRIRKIKGTDAIDPDAQYDNPLQPGVNIKTKSHHIATFLSKGCGVVMAHPVYWYTYEHFVAGENNTNTLWFPPYEGKKFVNPDNKSYHAVSLSGYDKHWRDNQLFTIQGSYGTSFGDGGVYYLKQEDMIKFCSDFRTVIAMEKTYEPTSEERMKLLSGLNIGSKFTEKLYNIL